MTDTSGGVAPPREAARVASRYQRVERPISGGVALAAAGVVATALTVLPVVQALVVSLAVLAAFRVPAFRSQGSARLTTDADPAAVIEDFASATPPPLALQWGLADRVDATDDGATYAFSTLFGLRSVEMTLATDVREGEDGETAVELAVTAGGKPWGTYDATIRGDGDDTVVDIEWRADRRFGLRRLPQALVAARYRGDALAAQGYRVAARDTSLTR